MFSLTLLLTLHLHSKYPSLASLPKHDTEDVSNQKVEADKQREPLGVVCSPNVQVLGDEWNNTTKNHSRLSSDADDVKEGGTHDAYTTKSLYDLINHISLPFLI